jgi:hypothetical protein
MSKVAATANWIDRLEALAILECGLSTFIGLVKEGRIRKRDFGRKCYWADDVQKLANEEAAKPAN